MIYAHSKELNRKGLIAIITLFSLMGSGNKAIIHFMFVRNLFQIFSLIRFIAVQEDISYFRRKTRRIGLSKKVIDYSTKILFQKLPFSLY